MYGGRFIDPSRDDKSERIRQAKAACATCSDSCSETQKLEVASIRDATATSYGGIHELPSAISVDTSLRANSLGVSQPGEI